ncbi:MAG TPA: glycosyltransferase family 2 protein, partial [Gemmatimonadaceae bacterium]|nr:glycosyltransferase family 2 protein [Gemmatimonadaceae bacterium]
MSPDGRVPRLAVIVPAYRCASTLRASLAGLLASDLPRHEWELVVIDDGSGDDTAAVAALHADRVVTIEDGPRGPAHARNTGAAATRAPLLVFIDADVVVAPATLRQLAVHLRDGSGTDAVFGAYDTTPADSGFVSQYRNLLHHRVHAQNAGIATTFWAGCGAVRRDAFDSVGQFDAMRYPRPQVEDIELGYRLTA